LISFEAFFAKASSALLMRVYPLLSSTCISYTVLNVYLPKHSVGRNLVHQKITPRAHILR